MTISLLDNDFYALTMSLWIWRYMPGHMVTYAFKNRSLGVRLSEAVDMGVLRAKLAELSKTRFNESELKWIATQGFIPAQYQDEYIEYLRHLMLPEIYVGNEDGYLIIEYTGSWASTVLLETPILAIVNEAYFESRMDKKIGRAQLDNKIQILKEHPEIQFLEFGTRRRAAQDWQIEVLGTLLANIPDNVVGTSNPLLAKEFGIRASGTMAHQLFMVTAAVLKANSGDEDWNPLISAERKVLGGWEELYAGHPELLIALTDTFSTPHFLSHAAGYMATWPGVRQDSGNPFAIGQLYLNAWRALKIDPITKKILFSDGLDLTKMLSLYYHFAQYVQIGYGWGTDLMCSVGPPHLNIVIKPWGVDGLSTVKLSDDLTKAIGSKTEIELYKDLAGYGEL